MASSRLPADRTVSRRLALGGGFAGIAALSLASCSGGSQDDDDGAGREEPDPDRPLESPMLTELVESGDLPPLEERLPVEADRLVVEPQEFGQYGHTYQGAVGGEGDGGWILRIVGFEPMLRPSVDGEEVGLPGTLTAIEPNDDGTELTLHLREGMRWSDGEPVTADDVMFNLQDVYFNEELYAFPPDFLLINDQPCTGEKIDDYTVRLTYPEPKGGDVAATVTRMRSGAGNLLWYPKHYCEQFLPDFNDDAQANAEDEGFLDWLDYWSDRNDWMNNPERPTLHAWKVTRALNAGGSTRYERNPYYWKVDDGGAQLPYIDHLEFEVVQDDEVMLLKALNGEIDYHSRHFNQDANRPVLADGREAGDYDFVPIERAQANQLSIALNLCHQDEELREVFQDKNFRIGLSHAIDRQEIIDTAFQRRGEHWQVAPRPDSIYFDEEFAKQYTDYDPDLANEILDEVAPDRDSAGYRLRPDGQRISFAIDITTFVPEWAPAMDLVTRYWDEVGIDARLNPIERTLFYDRKAASANQHDANVWDAPGGIYEETDQTRFWFPAESESNFATPWAEWFTTRGEGENAMEPPEEARRQMELFRQFQAEADPEVGEQHMREILQIAKEQFWVIGISLPDEGYGIVKNDMHNVMTFAEVVRWDAPAYTNPSAWFFDR